MQSASIAATLLMTLVAALICKDSITAPQFTECKRSKVST